MSFFFPPECLQCGKEDFWICKECLNKIILEKSPPPYHLEYFEKVFVCSGWENMLIQSAVKKIKFEFATGILDDVQPLFEKRIREWDIQKDAIFVPVPLHFLRKNERGFNQSALLAKIFSEIFCGEIKVYELIKRTRNTPHQSHLSKEDRKENIASAFLLNTKIAQKISPLTPIILVDDVLTTGNTMMECAKVLKSHGYEKIWGMVVAHGK
ncbi:ComF family protein [Candidatus Peregrinibacteria bacterium]|nr:ComF family protein [Candidatus Peregrinibacteria bacterium]